MISIAWFWWVWALQHSSSSLRSRSKRLYHGSRTQEDRRSVRHGEARPEGPAVPPQGAPRQAREDGEGRGARGGGPDALREAHPRHDQDRRGFRGEAHLQVRQAEAGHPQARPCQARGHQGGLLQDARSPGDELRPTRPSSPTGTSLDRDLSRVAISRSCSPGKSSLGVCRRRRYRRRRCLPASRGVGRADAPSLCAFRDPHGCCA